MAMAIWKSHSETSNKRIDVIVQAQMVTDLRFQDENLYISMLYNNQVSGD